MKFSVLLLLFSVIVLSDALATAEEDPMSTAKVQLNIFQFAIDQELKDYLHEIYYVVPDTPARLAEIFAEYQPYDFEIDSATQIGEDIQVITTLHPKWDGTSVKKHTFVLKKDPRGADGWMISE